MARLNRFRSSLRLRALVVVVLVIAAPVLSVWFSDLADVAYGWQMERRVSHVASLIAQDPDTMTDSAWLWGVRARLLAPEGHLLREAGRPSRLRATVFFGPDGGPSLESWDASQPPLGQRAAVRSAPEDGAVTSQCVSAEDNQLLVCFAAARTARGETVYVVDGSRRAIRSLYAVRYPLLKLALFVALPGMVLGWWLGWRMVRPVELLRAQVLERKARSSLAPIRLDRDDEFGDLAASFNALLEALAARDAANESFAADLAHELKNPLAAIGAVAEVLERGRPVDGARAARLARALRSSGGRLEALVNQFLDLARAEAGLTRAHREPVDLRALGQGVVDGIAADPRFAAVDFHTAVDEGQHALVLGAAERLETALRNLLDNAAAFACEQHPDGGGRVALTVSTGDDDEVTLTVEDNGPGIAAADRDKLFERFFSRRRGGTGLGLALTRAIVEAHGGTISADAEPGAGARFTVRLPRARPGRSGRAVRRPEAEHPEPGRAAGS